MQFDQLRDEHRQMRREVPRKRSEAAREDATLGKIYRAAMSIWDGQKAEGMTLADRILNLAKTLRASWPQTREWKYLCECSDTGLKMSDCRGDATCGRKQAHMPHEFGAPCWCELGKRFRDKPKPSAEDFTAAGKSRSFSKASRYQ